MHEYNGVREKNIEYERLFSESKLMSLLDRAELKQQENIDILMDCIQPLSDCFQRCVLLRYSLSNNPYIAQIAKEHMDEEQDHNDLLRKERNNKRQMWDPVLEASTSWFAFKIMTLDEIEKHFLMHSVLEESANIFFNKANQVISQTNPYQYFQIHSEYDEKHAQMGAELYGHLTSFHFESLLRLQKQGWDMMLLVCNRIAQLVISNFTAKKAISNMVNEIEHA